MLTALEEVIADLSSRTDVSVVILRGEGTDFCVGADLAGASEQRTLRRVSVAADTDRLGKASATVAAFYRLSHVTIAAIDGGCAGAGLSLALAADLRVASDRAAFNTAFVGAGLSGDLGWAWLLTRAVGPACARHLMLDRGKIGARTAHGLGLVTDVVPAEEFVASTAASPGRIAAQASLALRGAKQNLLAAENELDGYLPGEIDRVRHLPQQRRSRGCRGLFERRTPVFNRL